MPDIPGGPVNLKPLGSGDPNSQKWRIVRNEEGDGFKIEGYYEAPEGIPPIGMGPAWKNYEPEPGTPIAISLFKDASAYNVEVVRPHENGLIISILPKDDYFVTGINRFAGASEDTVEITAVPVVNPPLPHPGWFISPA
ncbi:hypothetical protein RhiJN_23080 [Ceratobasidium sp. AG-Ba]|nr:hypothetical protein RhiJN_23080 [Ceratobasidium sp. AG-Ba]